MTRMLIALVEMLAWLPLPVVRGVGVIVCAVLWGLALERRKIAGINLALCFPQIPERQRKWMAFRVFVHFAQAWLDRGWLWRLSSDRLTQRLEWVGNLESLQTADPIIVFAPHFFGLDAGWTALGARLERPIATIYTPQRNRAADRWIRSGREKAHSRAQLFARDAGIRPVLAALQGGSVLYLLPDMDHGQQGAEFVPFFGVPAATMTSLPRMARLCGARVVPLRTLITRTGYRIEVGSPWLNYPSDDTSADALRMNHELEQMIQSHADQYYWLHKRFKTAAPGTQSPYP